MDRICHEECDAQKLVGKFPAQLHDRNKEIVFELSSPPGAIHSGTVSFSRSRQLPRPKSVTRSETHPRFELREDYFTYGESPYGHIDWHLNFAHYDLFCAYGGPLFAQVEMQVAEHPALASLRHALVGAGIEPLTVRDDIATPALIMGVERRCRVSTDANSDEEGPHGLYENSFSSASEDAIRRAVEVFEPPTNNNILAMEAPMG